jgi:hypothetical protein
MTLFMGTNILRPDMVRSVVVIVKAKLDQQLYEYSGG